MSALLVSIQEEKKMNSSLTNHRRSFNSPRRSQSLCCESCQNILYKSVFEHFAELPSVAALLLASKSFQNSSFGAHFIVNFAVENDSIDLIAAFLSPSSCFSVQFVPSLIITMSKYSCEAENNISTFIGELVKTKYLPLQLRSLALDNVTAHVVELFFNNNSCVAWSQLMSLNLEGSHLTENVLDFIAKSALRLANLNLSGSSGVTDAGLRYISLLDGVTSLNLSLCSKITDASLELVSSQSNITSLDLSYCRMITDAGLEHIGKLSRVTSINLAFCDDITDVGMEHLSKLSTLTELKVARCQKITDAGLEHISKLPDIRKLCLTFCEKVTDAGMLHFSAHTSLTSLDLRYLCGITDVGLEYISKFSNMLSLDVERTPNISREAKNKFGVDFPNCRIYH